jgi:hypothetical protein
VSGVSVKEVRSEIEVTEVAVEKSRNRDVEGESERGRR